MDFDADFPGDFLFGDADALLEREREAAIVTIYMCIGDEKSAPVPAAVLTD